MMDTTLERLKAPLAQSERATGTRRAVAFASAVAIIGVAAYAETLAEPSAAESVARFCLVSLWTVAGVILTIARPRETMGLVLLAGASVGALASYAAVASAQPDAASAVALLRWVALAALPAAGMHVVLALPDGSLGKPSRRTAVAVAYATSVLLGTVLWVLRPKPLWIVLVAAGVALLVGGTWSSARYRRSTGVERQRMQWFGLAVTIGIGVAAVSGGMRVLVGWPDDWRWVAAVATGPIPLALAITASARLVARVDRLLAHTVALAGLTGVVVLSYLVIVIGLGRVPDEQERTLLALSMVAAMVAALLYLPTRERLGRLATRIVYGDRRPPDDVLKTFGTKIFSRAFPLDELLLQLCESLRRTFELDAAEVWTGGEGSFERAVSDPERTPIRITLGPKEQPVVARAGVSGPAWLKIWLPQMLEGREDKLVRVAPIVHAGELLGMIVVEKKQTEEIFDEEKERVLAELARTVGVALHNVQLDSALQASLDELRRQAEDLRRSRQRIVASADAARRKLERDLHDGAQQHLVALSVKIGLVKNIGESEPEMARAMLDELTGDVQVAIQALRDLSHGIYPPVLVDRGLVGALEAAASRAAITTNVEPRTEIKRYEQETEAAVYFCCLEAVQNAAKHAGDGSQVTISLWEEAGGLLFEVADNGAGFDASSKGSGAGFVNMRDRLGAIGGVLTIDSAPGRGTKISGRIPISG